MRRSERDEGKRARRSHYKGILFLEIVLSLGRK
jgi:hypothetical protein